MVLDDIQVGDNAHADRQTEDILDLSFSLKDLMLKKGVLWFSILILKNIDGTFQNYILFHIRFQIGIFVSSSHKKKNKEKVRLCLHFTIQIMSQVIKTNGSTAFYVQPILSMLPESKSIHYSTILMLTSTYLLNHFQFF